MFNLPSKLSTNWRKSSGNRSVATTTAGTRDQIFQTALRLFRNEVFDETTMRQIAREAGVTVGLAYHYFPAKESLVMAYYERVQTEHRILVHEKLTRIRPLRDRLIMMLQTKLEILKGDRKLMGALFRYSGDPEHPLSFLGNATAAQRGDCIALFAEALESERLPSDLQELLPLALWALHMGLLLYFLYDLSPAQRRTHKLVYGAVDLMILVLKVAKFPLLRPVRRSVMNLLSDAALLPSAASR